MLADDDTRFRAVQSRDDRFDGWFVTAVTSTGIYCRPSCPAMTPRREHVRFFPSAAAAQQAGFEAVRPGVACQEIDRAARKVISDAGYGEYFIHRVGHGIGLTTHEPPYMVEGEERLIEPGMCFSIEPGIYLPDRFGVRIEDIVVATEDGGRRLNNTTREMQIVS